MKSLGTVKQEEKVGSDQCSGKTLVRKTVFVNCIKEYRVISRMQEDKE